MATNVKPTLSDEEFESLKAKYGGNAVCVLTAAGAVAFRCPTRDEYREFMKDPALEESQEKLCAKCVIFPSAEAFDVMVERKPGIVDVCISPVLELAGMEVEPRFAIVPHDELDEVVVVTTREGTFTFRCPTRIEHRQYEDESGDLKKKPEAIDRLVMGCIVQPPPDEFRLIVARKPALAATCYKAVRTLSGIDNAVIVKK